MRHMPSPNSARGRGAAARVRAAAAFAAALLWATPAPADIIVLADGRKLEGEVKLDGDTYVVKGRFGAMTRIPKYMVVRIEKTEPAGEKLAKARKAVEAKGADAGADDWFKLGKLATELGLRDEAREIHEKVVSLEPDHEGARAALGQVLHEGKWLPEEEAMALQGKVRVGGRWVDRDEAEEAAKEAERSAPGGTPEKVDQAKAMIKALGPEYVTCTACSGSGMAVWIPCHQCDKSGKPGYSFFGDRYDVCMTCKGTAKLPGIKCGQCRGLGKYDPEKKRTPRGRYIPSGFTICSTCNGTGVETWAKCLQCARSKYPGFCYFGERYSICMKCGGAAKIPALKCARCQRSGLVREK